MTMKICSKCKADKPLTDFCKKSASRDGLSYICKSCKKMIDREWRSKNVEAIRKQRREYRARNKEAINAHRAVYRAANRDKISEYNKNWYTPERARRYHESQKKKHPNMLREQYQRHKESVKIRAAEWKKRNPTRMAAYCMARIARKKNATPTWANKFFMEEIYDLARLRTESTGITHHVDHIYPLNSDVVSGLHCEFNLQILTDTENYVKSNKMPEVSYE